MTAKLLCLLRHGLFFMKEPTNVFNGGVGASTFAKFRYSRRTMAERMMIETLAMRSSVGRTHVQVACLSSAS